MITALVVKRRFPGSAMGQRSKTLGQLEGAVQISSFYDDGEETEWFFQLDKTLSFDLF